MRLHVVFGIVGMLGCSGDEVALRRHEAARGESAVGGTVVSTVEGFPIHVAEVERLARRSGLTPGDALRRLQDEILLYVEASSRGFAVESATDQRAVARAMVQALLDLEVEDRVPPSVVSEAEVDAELRAQASRFDVPERRRASHLLVKRPDGADDVQSERAAAVAERLLADARSAEADEAAREWFARVRGASAVDGFELVVEDLEPAARDGTFVAPFESALFSLDATGWIPRVVETEFGWHVVRVTEISPRRVTSPAEARQIVHGELLARRRSTRLEELIRGLERAARIQRNAESIARQFARGGPFDEAEDSR